MLSDWVGGIGGAFDDTIANRTIQAAEQTRDKE
jgi:hypothetical protein